MKLNGNSISLKTKNAFSGIIRPGEGIRYVTSVSINSHFKNRCFPAAICGNGPDPDGVSFCSVKI